VSSFPAYRPRRLRRTAPLRRLIRETHLDPGQLILPVFVRSGAERRVAVESMPGVAQTSVDEMLRDAAAAAEAGKTSKRMVSRAYHDSLFMARIAPVAMLFIPCRGGVSHRPDEYSSPEWIGAVVGRLAGRQDPGEVSRGA